MMMNSIIESENQNDTSSSVLNLDPRERIALESNYIQYNISAFKTIHNRNYQKSADIYKDCLSIAEQLKDSYKINDSLCNYSIALFYNGKLKECLEKLESAYRSYTCQQSLKLAGSVKTSSDIRITLLNAKIIANLTIVYLSLNRVSDATNTFKALMEIINGQSKIENSLTLLKSVLYVFFRIESLVDVADTIPGRTYAKDNDNEDFHKRVITKIINCFHAYLKNGNIDIWIQCLSEEMDNLKQLKDYNGLIFAIFNLQSGVYIKSININDVNSANSAKAKLSALIKALVGEFEEKAIDKVVNGIKEKMEFTAMMYKTLFDKEEILQQKVSISSQNNNNTEENKKNVFFINFLLNYSQKYIAANITDPALKSQLKMQIDITMKLIKNNKIDLSNLKLKLLSPEIEKAISLLGNNLIAIRSKCVNKNISIIFNRFKRKVQNFKLNITYEKITSFTRDCYSQICVGDTMTKINLTTKGQKNHFYQLNFDTDSILIYKKKDSTKYDKNAPFSSIKKIIFGIFSSNLKKKIKNLEFGDQPWIYMSIVFDENNTIDLCVGDDKIKKWFYGLFYYLSSTQRHYKIPSATGFVLNRIKMKAMSTLIKMSENQTIDLSAKFNIKKLINTYKDMPQRVSFSKVLIEMRKVKNL